MIDANNTIIFLNVLFILILGSITFHRTIYAKIAVVIWAAFAVTFEYYLLWAMGGFGLSYQFFFLDLPFYTIPILVIIIQLLFDDSQFLKKSRYLFAVVFIGLFSCLRPVSGVADLTNMTGNALDRSIMQGLYTMTYLCCLLAPLGGLISPSRPLWAQWCHISFSEIKRHATVLGTCSSLLIVVYVISNIFLKNSIIMIGIPAPFSLFARYTALSVFYYIFIDHFLCFGILKTVLSTLVPDDSSGKWIIFVSACAYILVRYYYHPAFMVREFIFGLIFAYLYKRTNSLAYGVILHSLIYIFTEY